MRRAVVWSGGSERTPRRRDYVARMRTPKTQTAGLSSENWRLQCTQNATLGPTALLFAYWLSYDNDIVFSHVYLIIRLHCSYRNLSCTLAGCMHTKTENPVGCSVDCLAWTRETSTRESFSMERGPELSAVLMTVLILCIVLIFYLSFVPEDRQQKDKDAADAFTATVIPSFKKKPDDKKTT